MSKEKPNDEQKKPTPPVNVPPPKKKEEPSGSRWTTRKRGNGRVLRDSTANDREIGTIDGDELAGYVARTMDGESLGTSKTFDEARGLIVERYKKRP